MIFKELCTFIRKLSPLLLFVLIRNKEYFWQMMGVILSLIAEASASKYKQFLKIKIFPETYIF